MTLKYGCCNLTTVESSSSAHSRSDMPRTPKLFEEKYPDFTDLAFDFSDPPPTHISDYQTARSIRSDLPVVRRVEIFRRLLADSERLLGSVDEDFEPLRLYLNKDFKQSSEARQWLEVIRCAWIEELLQLEGKLH